jgi:hypothetical protein
MALFATVILGAPVAGCGGSGPFKGTYVGRWTLTESGKVEILSATASVDDAPQEKGDIAFSWDIGFVYLWAYRSFNDATLLQEQAQTFRRSATDFGEGVTIGAGNASIDNATLTVHFNEPEFVKFPLVGEFSGDRAP